MCVHLRYSFACMRVRCGSFAIIYSSSLLCHSAYDFASLICTLTFSVGMQGGNWWSNNECFELDVQLLKNGIQCPMIRQMSSVNQVSLELRSHPVPRTMIALWFVYDLFCEWCDKTQYVRYRRCLCRCCRRRHTELRIRTLRSRKNGNKNITKTTTKHSHIQHQHSKANV